MKLIKGSIIKYGESLSIGAGLGLSEDQTGLVELITSGVGGGATNLDSLTDVVITSAATGEYLRYNGTNWVDATIQAGDIPAHTHTANQINSGTFPSGRYTFTDGPVTIGSNLGSSELLLVSGAGRFSAGNGAIRTTQLGLGRFEDVATSSLYYLQTADTDPTYGGDSLFFYTPRWASLVHFVRGSPLGDRRYAMFESTNHGVFRLYDGSTELGNIGVELAAGTNPNVIVMSGTLVGKFQALGAVGGPAIYIGAQSSHVVSFIVNNSPRFNLTTAGHFVAATDNVNDIGASAATRPRFIYLASGMVIGTDPGHPSGGYGSNVRIENIARVGQMVIGTWPFNAAYAYIAHQSLGQAIDTNFGFLQDSTGFTIINAAVGKTVELRVGNASIVTASASSFVVQSDPGGSEKLRVGGNARFSGYVMVSGTGTYLLDMDATEAQFRLQKTGASSNLSYLYNNGTGLGLFDNTNSRNVWVYEIATNDVRFYSPIIIPNSATGTIWGRNAANSANLNLLGLDSGDNLNIGRDDNINNIQLFGTTQIFDDATSPIDVFTVYGNGVVTVGKDLGGSRTLRVSGSVQTGGILYSPSVVVYPIANKGRYYSESDLSGGSAGYAWRAQSAGTDQKMWDVLADVSPTLKFRLLNDNESAFNTWLQVNRGTATNITSIVFPSGTMIVGPDPGGSGRIHVGGGVSQTGGTEWISSSIVRWNVGLSGAGGFQIQPTSSATNTNVFFLDSSSFIRANIDTATGEARFYSQLIINSGIVSATSGFPSAPTAASSMVFGTGSTPTGFRGGFSHNVYWDGSNWRIRGDGANNAGMMILGGIGDAGMGFFVFPTTGAGDQTFSNATADSTYRMAHLNSAGLFFVKNNIVVVSDPGGTEAVRIGGSLRLNTIGPFKGTPTGTLRTDDVWAYNGTEWTNRFLQVNFAAGDVVAAMHSGTNYSYVNTVTSPSGGVTAPTNAPTLTAIYKGMIVDMSAYGALPANQQFVTEWSIDSGSSWQTSGAIVGTSNKIVHSNLTLGVGYRYRYKIRGATDSAYSPSSAVTTPSNQAETNAFGLIVASQISVANLAAINANIGTITAGLLQDPQGKFKIDLNNRLITMIDEQGPPITRIRLGELNTGLEDWGLEINDSLGRTVLNADGLGADARIFGQNRQLSQVMTFIVPNAEFDLWNGSTVLHWSVDTTGGATYNKESSIVYSNDFSLKYSNPDNSTNEGWHGISTLDAYKGAFCATLRPGLTYQIRTAARCSRTDQGQQYRIKVSSNDSETIQQIKAFPIKIANTWQTDTWALTINSGASANSKVYIEFNRNGDTEATDFYIDSIRLVEIEEAQFYDNTITGVTLTVDWAYGPTQKILLTSASTTLNFLNGRPGQSYVLEVQQDSTGSRAITTYDSKVYWPADTAPTLTTTANKVDLLGFECVYLPGGTDIAYMGRSIASNYTQNDVRAFTGSFNWNSGMAVGTDIVVSGIPFAPKLFIFWSGGRGEQLIDSGGSRDSYMMFGAATPGAQFAIGTREADNVASTQADRSSTTLGCVLEMGNGAITGMLSSQSFDSNGITLNVEDQSAVVHQIMYLALGGNTFVAAVAGPHSFPNSVGYTALTHGLSPNTPTGIIFATAGTDEITGEDVNYPTSQWGIGFGVGSASCFSIAGFGNDASATPISRSGGYAGTSILSWDITTGGAINNRSVLSGQSPFTSTQCKYQVLETLGAPLDLFYTIAIGGCKVMVTNERSQTDLITDITLTPSAQLQPQAILMFTHASGTTTSNTTDLHMQAGIGGAAKLSTGAISQQCSIIGNRYFGTGANSQTMAGHYYNAIYANLNIETDLLEGRMRVTGMDAGTAGIKFRMDDADPQRYRFGALIIGN